MSFRVLITDRAWPDCQIEQDILREVDAEIVEAPSGDEATLVELARDVDAIGTCWAPVTEAVISASPRCRVISRFGIGLDNIHVPTATARKIPVTFVPDYCLAEVAEHTLALLFACARNIGFFHHRTKQGEYALQAAPTMHRITGRTLGLLGFGRIGQAVAERAVALGLNVIAHSRSGRSPLASVRMVDLPTLLRESDYLSLHLPLTAASRGIIRLPQLEQMRPGAFLINTSRGALVDPQDLWTALERNLIAGAALDVFEPEPPDLSLPLYRDERVIVTPHAAFLSAESLVELRTRAARNIADVLAGRRPEHIANPEVLADSI